ncbi:MAG: DoxX family protein [Flavobacteriaceae bacterium]|jgi:uncharacterized membrane protein YphA (DoxX/SURF4 family)|nr:hypothetical protein [Flavobacteriaceae bacterium]OUW68936.1 MAG: hypothetical protein CBD62_00675 [Candidatus Pelagibacter sp. TMED202]|tara:strand:+ start:358 stop:735 length:378 start_codon:yes stop_codon:yes gene_type:complete
MKILKGISMITVAAVVLNVWLFRFGKATIYRGGDATNMIEEFAVYGLNETMVYLVGGLKILAAIGLLIGFYNKKTITPAAGLMAMLMVGAIVMHFKVGDEIIKFLPAGIMFVLSSLIIIVNRKLV